MDDDRDETFDSSDPYGYAHEDDLCCVSGPLPGELDVEEATLYAAVCDGVAAA